MGSRLLNLAHFVLDFAFRIGALAVLDRVLVDRRASHLHIRGICINVLAYPKAVIDIGRRSHSDSRGEKLAIGSSN